MSTWLRNLVMLVVLGTWVGVVIAYLVQGKLPDAALLGIPAAVVLALAPPKFGRQPPDPSTPAPAEETTS
ncbi:hypothetical protein [Micromonospora aurantiaca (nom. illeg.)]|uniref:hypothetical protein n=1 Tax=Micromonospora aurantiaca (nom. illeg.) TaxID=47850 RepID=UPI0033D89DD0